MKSGRKTIATQCFDERRINPRVSFEPFRDACAAFDFVQEITERARAESMEAFDKALPAKPPDRRKLGLRGGLGADIFRIVDPATKRRCPEPRSSPLRGFV